VKGQGKRPKGKGQKAKGKKRLIALRRVRGHFIRVAFALSVAMARSVGAQGADPHAALPERPSVATHAHTVAPGWVEVELGFERAHDDGRFGDEAFPMALKLGLQPRVQLSVSAAVDRPDGRHARSVDEVNLGIKWRVAERMPIAGDVAILPSVTVPARSGHDTAASFLLVTSRTLGLLTLDLNVGHTRRSGDSTLAPTSESLWAAALGGPLKGRFSWVGELSGSPSTSGAAGRSATINALVGAAATLSPPLVIDVAVRIPVAGPDSYAILTGAVWNVGRLWTSRPSTP
jgi:hypothetical protein